MTFLAVFKDDACDDYCFVTDKKVGGGYHVALYIRVRDEIPVLVSWTKTHLPSLASPLQPNTRLESKDLPYYLKRIVNKTLEDRNGKEQTKTK